MIRTCALVMVAVSTAFAASSGVHAAATATHAFVRAADTTLRISARIEMSDTAFAVVHTHSASDSSVRQSGQGTALVPIELDVNTVVGTITFTASQPLSLTVPENGLSARGRVVRIGRDQVGGRLHVEAQ